MPRAGFRRVPRTPWAYALPGAPEPRNNPATRPGSAGDPPAMASGMEERFAREGSEYLREKNFKTLAEWLTAEVSAPRPPAPRGRRDPQGKAPHEKHASEAPLWEDTIPPGPCSLGATRLAPPSC